MRGISTASDNTGPTASFQYDSLGRRTAKTVNGTASGFLYGGLDESNFVQELLGSSNTSGVASTVLSAGTDETLARERSNQVQSAWIDANNNTVQLSGADQAKVVGYTYEAYGKSSNDNATSTNSQQYTGRENDSAANNGLYYYRARYYMPGCGRFISEDPIGWGAGQTNGYAYVGGDAIQNLDPSGLIARDADPLSCSSTHSIPKFPPGENVFDNMDRVRVMSYSDFYDNVRNNGRWDYKRQGAQYEDAGNFNFGATASEIGIPDQVAQRGAGWYQQNRGAGGGSSTWWGIAPYGDQASDNRNIRLGEALARDYSSGECVR